MFDIIGTIYKPTGLMITDSDGAEYPETAPVDGYHVNVLTEELTELLQPYVVTPKTLVRVFAGANTTALKFSNRDEWLALGFEEVETNG